MTSRGCDGVTSHAGYGLYDAFESKCLYTAQPSHHSCQVRQPSNYANDLTGNWLRRHQGRTKVIRPLVPDLLPLPPLPSNRRLFTPLVPDRMPGLFPRHRDGGPDLITATRTGLPGRPRMRWPPRWVALMGPDPAKNPGSPLLRRNRLITSGADPSRVFPPAGSTEPVPTTGVRDKHTPA